MEKVTDDLCKWRREDEVVKQPTLRLGAVGFVLALGEDAIQLRGGNCSPK
jgi:hypothetical protein